MEKAQTFCGSQNINYSYKIDLNNDGTQDIQSSEDTINGNFIKGTHKITWKATDPCGNIIQCSYLIHIKDCTPPNLLCISGLTQSIDQPNCDATFHADQFILSLSDNCTPTNLLQIGMRRANSGTGFPDKDTVTFQMCETGVKFLEVWVRDTNGLTNQCSNYVIVQAGDQSCSCIHDGNLSFSGCARTANNQKLGTYQPRVTLTSTAGVQPPYSLVKFIATTDSCFSLPFLAVPFNGDYQGVVRVYRPDNPLNGVTTFDLVLISKHILGIEPFTSAYQMEAADVNNSNSVTTFDIVEIRKLILGIYDTLTSVPAWRFVKPLANPSALGGYTGLVDTYQVNIPNLQSDLNFAGYNFVGIKYGDVNYTASLTGDEPADDRNPVIFSAKDRWLSAGEEALVEFRISDPADLNGWQLALSGNSELLEFESVEGLPDGNYFLTPSGLRALWFDAANQSFGKGALVFTLKIKAKQALQLSEALFIDPQLLHAEAYRSQPDGSNTRNQLALHFEDQAAHAGCYGVSPNPFGKETTFRVYSAGPGEARLELFSLSGKQVWTRKYELNEGLQFLQLEAQDLPSETVLFYRLEMNGEVFAGKLIRE